MTLLTRRAEGHLACKNPDAPRAPEGLLLADPALPGVAIVKKRLENIKLSEGNAGNHCRCTDAGECWDDGSAEAHVLSMCSQPSHLPCDLEPSTSRNCRSPIGAANIGKFCFTFSLLAQTSQ